MKELFIKVNEFLKFAEERAVQLAKVQWCTEDVIQQCYDYTFFDDSIEFVLWVNGYEEEVALNIEHLEKTYAQWHNFLQELEKEYREQRDILLFHQKEIRKKQIEKSILDLEKEYASL